MIRVSLPNCRNAEKSAVTVVFDRQSPRVVCNKLKTEMMIGNRRTPKITTFQTNVQCSCVCSRAL